MKPKVLITGGAGRIGNRVLKLLLERDYRVRALVHRNAPKGISGHEVELVQGDLLDRKSLMEAAQGCQIICHLAAIFDMFGRPVNEVENDPVFENIIRGTYNLLEAARLGGDAELFLNTSSDAAYSVRYNKQKGLITEESELRPKPGRFYAIAKLITEELCVNYRKSYGLPYINIREGWSLGAEDVLKIFEYEFWADFLNPADKKELGQRMADGKGVLAPLMPDGSPFTDQLGDADDTALGYVLAIENRDRAVNQVFNIAGPEPFAYRDVIELVSERSGLSWASPVVEGMAPYHISTEKAKRMIGYEPRSDIRNLLAKAFAYKEKN